MQLPAVTPLAADPQPNTQALREKAMELEAAFLAEMLAHAGFGKARESFGGGVGEEQFSSFLRNEQAKALVAKGGIGLAEQIFRSLVAQQGQAPANIAAGGANG